MEKEKKKMGCLPKILIFAIIVITVIAVVLVATSTKDTNNNSENKPTSSQSKSSKETKEKVIYSDSDLKVTYLKISDSADLGVTTCNVHLKIENLSKKTIVVSLVDGYANDTSIFLGSGVPMKLAPGKKSSTPFFFGYDNIFKSADEVEKLEFKIKIFNEDYTETLKTTKSLTIKVK